MERRGAELTFAVYKWEIGWGAISLGWSGWVADYDHGICTLFPLFPCPRKVINVNCGQGCEGKLIPKKLSLIVLRGVTYNKRSRVHNNIKIEYLLL